MRVKLAEPRATSTGAVRARFARYGGRPIALLKPGPLSERRANQRGLRPAVASRGSQVRRFCGETARNPFARGSAKCGADRGAGRQRERKRSRDDGGARGLIGLTFAAMEEWLAGRPASSAPLWKRSFAFFSEATEGYLIAIELAWVGAIAGVSCLAGVLGHRKCLRACCFVHPPLASSIFPDFPLIARPLIISKSSRNPSARAWLRLENVCRIRSMGSSGNPKMLPDMTHQRDSR